MNLKKNMVICLPSLAHNKIGGYMLQAVKYLKCKACCAINKDLKWRHSIMAKMDATSYTTRESTYCPNCSHTEYEEIEYEDLSDGFKYKMHKENIKSTLESLEKNCESKYEFLEIMDSLGYASLEL